jgi:CheY-like chemotaxis protein
MSGYAGSLPRRQSVHPFVRGFRRRGGNDVSEAPGRQILRSRPNLILLDLPPKIDGREVLALIKQDDKLKTIPTAILTCSEAEEDIAVSVRHWPRRCGNRWETLLAIRC